MDDRSPPAPAFETVQLVELSALTDLARLGAAMRRSQKAYFRARRDKPHVPPTDELVAARAAELRFDLAVMAALDRERVCLPGMEGGGQ